MLHDFTATSQNAYQYKFLWQELQETGFYDMNARFYMPDLGIFGQHDPLSGKTLDPYGYAYQNPVFFTDPTGLEGDPIPGSSGTGNPQAIGTATSPIDVGEVILNASVKAVASNTLSIMPSNWLVCNGGGVSAPRLQDTSTPNIPEIRRSYKDFYPYRPDNTIEWYGFGGRANWGIATAAASVENLSGQVRVTTYGSSLKLYRPNANGNVFIKNQYTRTMGLSKIGNLAGKASFGLGVGMDAWGVKTYYQDPTSPNAVHPGKAGFNTIMGYVGLKGGIPGAIISTVYFGVDNYYPGGWVGASETADKIEKYEQQTTGHPFFSNSAIKF
ncbi:Yd repeat protein [Chryseobacterium sp. StRB126]|nr:Yd repeat protein [Chryseobacterium sp. StRB126]